MDADRMLDEEEKQALEANKAWSKKAPNMQHFWVQGGLKRQTNIKTVHGKDGGGKMNKSSRIV